MGEEFTNTVLYFQYCCGEILLLLRIFLARWGLLGGGSVITDEISLLG